MLNASASLKYSKKCKHNALKPEEYLLSHRFKLRGVRAVFDHAGYVLVLIQHCVVAGSWGGGSAKGSRA